MYIHIYVFQSDSMGDHDATSLHLLEEKHMLSLLFFCGSEEDFIGFGWDVVKQKLLPD